MVALALVVITGAVTGLSALYFYYHQPGVHVEYAEVSSMYGALGVANALSLFVNLLLLVLFCLWLHRAYQNLAGLERSLRYVPGMAVGAWFIPFLNLVLPLRAIWDMGDQYAAIAAAFPQYLAGRPVDASALRRKATIWFVLFWIAATLSCAGFVMGYLDNAPIHILTVIANGSRILPLIALFPLVEHFRELESIAYLAWQKGDYAQHQNSLEMEMQQPDQRGKSATWYREAKEAQGMMDEIDLFDK